jgi:hypothetical protein
VLNKTEEKIMPKQMYATDENFFGALESISQKELWMHIHSVVVAERSIEFVSAKGEEEVTKQL